MRKIKILGRIISWIITAALAVLLVCNVYTIVAREFLGQTHPTVFGWSYAVIISGSMDPTIQVDDLVVIHEQDDYNIGDIVTFHSGSSVVTHRIVGETYKGYQTKGDSNNAADTLPLRKSNVIGKVVFTVPKFGKLVQFISSPLGMMTLVVAGVLMIEIPYLTDKIKEKRNGGDNNE